MTLKIKENNNAFFLEGVINATTTKQFKKHLEFLLTYKKTVTINIEKVTAIDKNGLKAIEDIFYLAEINNKTFSIVGYGCKDIYESVNFSRVELA